MTPQNPKYPKSPYCHSCRTRHPLNRCGICDHEALACPCYDCLKEENKKLRMRLINHAEN